ncbi:MAG: alpha/beta hydrolase [Candidatus Aminicenantes bacterium]|nr:alpha/beta hydrolase [Candidatus Aminicenantes bacterium]
MDRKTIIGPLGITLLALAAAGTLGAQTLPPNPVALYEGTYRLTPYRRLRCPVLVTYGRNDPLVPVEESVELLRGVLAETGRRNLTVVVIPDTGHGLL